VTLDNPGGPTKNRRPALRGRILIDIFRGQERVRAWPKKASAKAKAASAERAEKFRLANWATKFYPAHVQAYYAAAVKDTPLLPRDLLIMNLYQRDCILISDNGRKYFPMTVVKDVSESLDAIQQLPGGMMARGPSWWMPIAPGAVGEVLSVTAVDEPPTWQAPPGAGGLSLIERITLAATATSINFTSIPATYEDLLLVGEVRGTNGTATVQIFHAFNGGGVGSFDFNIENRFGSTQVFANGAAQDGDINAGTSLAGKPSYFELIVLGYASTTWKKAARAFQSSETAASAGAIFEQRGISWWSLTDAIDEVNFTLSAGSFAIGSRISLYGRGSA
jgi:hypothetical protein